MSFICGILGKVDVVCSVLDILVYFCKVINFVLGEFLLVVFVVMSVFNKFKNEFVFGFNFFFDFNMNIILFKIVL